MSGVRDTTVQPLNPLDIALRCVDQSIRGMGYPGFQTQMLVWLAGRASVELLSRALARLGRRHPVITSRLMEPPGQPPVWRYRKGTRPELNVLQLASEERSAVMNAAAELLSASRDPSEYDPLQFHLLRRPGGGDVLVMQYSHVLMDN